ncbi:MAG: adenosylmethionine decarboxylase [Thermoproteota archaeon]|jgi:S-adenosylmethionine decarboxylase proenzyme, Bacillus form
MGAREQLHQNLTLELGKHIIADIRVENREILTDINFFRKIIYQSAIRANLKIIGEHYYRFDKTGGFSYVLFIAESHISIHTWPEYGYAALDIFTCGEKAKPWEAFNFIIQNLKVEKINIMELKRGILDKNITKEI